MEDRENGGKNHKNWFKKAGGNNNHNSALRKDYYLIDTASLGS
jgi:hypothetical protein